MESEGIDYRFLPLPEIAGETPNVGAIGRAVARDLIPLVRFLRTSDIDIVHTNDLRMHLTWPVSTRAADRCFVGHMRVVLSRSPMWRLLSAAAHRLFCISHSVYNSLPPNGRRRAVVIPNPVTNSDSFVRRQAKEALVSELGLEPDCCVIGYVGNMTPQKRPVVFIETAAEVARAFPKKFAFVLAGDDRGGELNRVIERANALGIGHCIHLMGFRMPIEPIIAASDILVAPGVNDGFGRTVAEAMMVETPVVASASGGHVELLENGRFGFLALPDDPSSFALGVLRLLEKPDIAKRNVQAAKTKALSEYRLDRHLVTVTRLYDELISHREGYPPVGSYR